MEINVQLRGDCQAELDAQHLRTKADLEQQGFHEYTMDKLEPGVIKLTYVDSKTWERLREQLEASCRNSLGNIGHDIITSGLTGIALT